VQELCSDIWVLHKYHNYFLTRFHLKEVCGPDETTRMMQEGKVHPNIARGQSCIVPSNCQNVLGSDWLTVHVTQKRGNFLTDNCLPSKSTSPQRSPPINLQYTTVKRLQRTHQKLHPLPNQIHQISQPTTILSASRTSPQSIHQRNRGKNPTQCLPVVKTTIIVVIIAMARLSDAKPTFSPLPTA
jgi:hypothetical protein